MTIFLFSLRIVVNAMKTEVISVTYLFSFCYSFPYGLTRFCSVHEAIRDAHIYLCLKIY